MFPQRQIVRAAPRFASQLRSPAVRSAFQRRLMSSPATGSSTENAFVRERRAVKEHAAATTGALPSRLAVCTWRLDLIADN